MIATFVLLNILIDISVCVSFGRCDGQLTVRDRFHRILATDLKMERTHFSEYKAYFGHNVVADSVQRPARGTRRVPGFYIHEPICRRFLDCADSGQDPNIAAGSMSYTSFERHLWLPFPPKFQHLIPFNLAALELLHVATHAVCHYAFDYVEPFEDDF